MENSAEKRNPSSQSPPGSGRTPAGSEGYVKTWAPRAATPVVQRQQRKCVDDVHLCCDARRSTAVTSSLRHVERGRPCPSRRPAPSHLAGGGGRQVTWSDCKCAAVARQSRAEQSRAEQSRSALDSSHELTNVSPSLPPSGKTHSRVICPNAR